MSVITAIMCTGRADPQFTWMADSYTRVLNVDPSIDAELIVVDFMMWGDDGSRRKQLRDAVNGRFSYRHVPPKPSAWQGPHRKTKSDFSDLNNARNTGIALAHGDYIALFDDCCVLDEYWLLWHSRMASLGIATAGRFCSYHEAEIVNGVVKDGRLHELADQRGDDMIKECGGGWLWGLNCGFPLSYALKVNGFDEQYSGQSGSDDCDMGVRLERAGCQIRFVPGCVVNQILATHEAVMDGDDHKRTPKEWVLADGIPHFANEHLIEQLAHDEGRIAPLGNDFDLSSLAANAQVTGEFPTKRTVEVDWRDGQRLEDMQ